MKDDPVDLRENLKQLNIQIMERTQYLQHVEEAIDRTIISGNERLHEIQFEVDSLLKKQNQLIEYNTHLEITKPLLYN